MTEQKESLREVISQEASWLFCSVLPLMPFKGQAAKVELQSALKVKFKSVIRLGISHT